MDTLLNTVENILSTNANTRDSDNLLYSYVLKIYAKQFGFTLDRVDAFFAQSFARYGIPTYESVSRCRRKLQEKQPSLRADKNVIENRKKEEKKYREYFKNERQHSVL